MQTFSPSLIPVVVFSGWTPWSGVVDAGASPVLNALVRKREEALLSVCVSVNGGIDQTAEETFHIMGNSICLDNTDWNMTECFNHLKDQL